MIVALYTFRMILQLLGIKDYGTYSVIGGIVVLFSFLSGAMTQSTQRYISYYIGNGDENKLEKLFSMSINLHLILSGIVFLLAETVGVWFVNTQMNFDTEMYIVNIVYQCTILTFIIQVLQIPYRATIISYEKMDFFAYLSILEVVLKLGVVFILFLIKDNRLIWYAVITSLVVLIITAMYKAYCSRHFKICHYFRLWDKKIFFELTGFSGWNLLGAIGNVGAQQGINILFNIFCGVAVNAAMGISNQVCNSVTSFFTNFQTAFNPQIIKLYASGEKDEFLNLILRASRVSFSLMFIVGVPIIICCRPILEFWLDTVPQYAVSFVQLMLIFSLIDALSGPLWTSAQACGKIKNYMLIIASLIFLNVPIAFFLLKYGFSPVLVIAVRVVLNLLIHNIRIFYLKFLIDFPVLEYFKKVMFPVCTTIIVSTPIPLYAYSHASNLIEFVLVFLLSFIIAISASWFILMTESERTFIKSKVSSVAAKWLKKTT